jgi:hypothetical protein
MDKYDNQILQGPEAVLARFLTACLNLATTANKLLDIEPKQISVLYIPTDESVYVINWNNPF